MKNFQKGSVIVCVLIIVIIALAATLSYVYLKKSSSPSSDQARAADTIATTSINRLDASTIIKPKVANPVVVGSSIHVISPNGGEIIKVGSTYKISWTASISDSSTLSIFLVNDSIHCPVGSVGCWTSYGITGNQKNTGSFIWDTNTKMFGDAGPNTVGVTPGSQYKIKICTVICDTSDAYFTVASDTPVLTQGIIGTVNATGCGTLPADGTCNDRPEHLPGISVSIKSIDAVDANGNAVSTHVVATLATDQYGNFQAGLSTGSYIACSNSNCTSAVTVKKGALTSIIISVPRS
ncbi:MAG: hypothetical protein JWO73_164 [Candidatus Taylorbacteria bacterium]|nr:hypothetical protein [Candidatus Taylorbacteria bacterium]